VKMTALPFFHLWLGMLHRTKVCSKKLVVEKIASMASLKFVVISTRLLNSLASIHFIARDIATTLWCSVFQHKILW
jgi:hypothetical protein